MLPKNFADDVRQQADIIRVVSDYVALKKRGANWIACCPFHSEKTPSFNVHPGKGIFKCFGCGAGGSIFDFVMQIEGCSFPEAVRLVAQRSGIPVPETQDQPAEARRDERRRKRVYELNEWACEFFESQLGLGGDGRRALEYVESRGLEPETRQTLRLGYAPNAWDALSAHLASRGVSRDEIAQSGLVTVREGNDGAPSGRYYDRFRGRVMFPIADAQGRVVAFGGRALSDDGPKYLNSPETPVYTKGNHLYGLNLAKDSIRRSGFAILVEGYLDFAVPYQAGVENVVASLGTALTEAQSRLLRRYMPRPQVIVNYDADAAGQEATRRSFETLLSQGFKINVLALPEGKDPDEFVRANGAQAYRALLKTTVPYLDYVVEQAVARRDVSRPAGKAEALNDVLPFVAQIADRIERVEYAERIARRLGIEDDLFRKELRRAASLRETKVRADRVAPPKKMTELERRFLVVLFGDQGVRSWILPSLENEDIEGLATEPIFRTLREMHDAAEPVGYAEVSERLADGARALLASLVSVELDDIVAERKVAWDEAIRKEAQACLVQLRKFRYERELSEIQNEINRAGTGGDDRFPELSLRKLELGRLIAALNQTQ
jgi:DNA primase